MHCLTSSYSVHFIDSFTYNVKKMGEIVHLPILGSVLLPDGTRYSKYTFLMFTFSHDFEQYRFNFNRLPDNDVEAIYCLQHYVGLVTSQSEIFIGSFVD